MKEIRLTISDGTKNVAIHIDDADAVLDQIAAGTSGLKDAAPVLKLVAAHVLASCSDTDKLEVGKDGGFHHKGDGSASVPFAI